MRHQIGVNPTDSARIHIGHLKEGRHLGVPGTTLNKDHIGHPPAFGLIRLTSTWQVLHDHRHACFDRQEQGIALFDRGRR